MAGTAWASETPLYQAAPAWIEPAPPIDVAKMDANTPIMVQLDNQQRIEGGRVWAYVQTAMRAATTEVMQQMGTIALPWLPDKGDLIVHGVEIRRGDERIDVLRGGAKFTVLRREQNLERQTLDGGLTATLSVEGLRIGDVLVITYSITQSDAALKGRAQTGGPAFTEPFRASFARTRISWPRDETVNVRGYADGVPLTPRETGGMRTIELKMPLPKPTELPAAAPGRFQRPPIIEATTFADWADVSRTMAPLFATDGLIAPGSPLAGEVARIKAADATPLGRAERALELVQGEIRYLLVGMNGGNYVPQAPAKTWEMRYGDCKAKTLLLLAMLRAMDIEAEAVLASIQAGDLVSRRLPMPAAFDHVIVHATIDGKSLWLDGTGTGARLADIEDTPPFRNVLPLRPGGAALTTIAMKPNARPMVAIDVTLDQRAGFDLPTLFDATVKLRGPHAAAMNVAAGQANAEQKRRMAQSAVSSFLGEPQITSIAIRYDAKDGTATMAIKGLVSTAWQREQQRLRMQMSSMVLQYNFSPDRAKPEWRAIPVATPDPSGNAFRMKIVLPGGGRGIVLDGGQPLSGQLMGALVNRTTTLAGDTATIDERIDQTGAEIAPDALADVRAKAALAKARTPTLLAPIDAPPRWQQAMDGLGSGALKPIETAFAAVIAADPKEVAGYNSRASFRAEVFDRRGAIADYGQVIDRAPTVSAYLWRSSLHEASGDRAKAMADAVAALQLEPDNGEALRRVAELKADSGDGAGAATMLRERIDQGGNDRFEFIAALADVQAVSGDTPGALATLDAAIAQRPGDPTLLNARCWIKGTRTTALDTALKDCTKAIELMDYPAAAMDSRAMAYFRLGRMDEALADLDAALQNAPDMAGSLFLRGIIARKLGRAGEADRDLKAARFVDPQIDESYARYGIRA